MSHNSDHSEDARAATPKRSLLAVSVLIITLIAGSVAIIIITDAQNPLHDALETGQCLAEQGAESFLEVLRHFLHHAYRWIFKTCG